jgi:hypothetical protein
MNKNPLALFHIVCVSVIAATAMLSAPARAQNIQTMANGMVTSYIKVARPRVVLLEGTAPIVGTIQQNHKYRLEFTIRNTGSELTFAPAQFRIQGAASELEFYSDSSFAHSLPPDYQGKPRWTHTIKWLPAGVRDFSGYFIARKNMATSDMTFRVGVYATVVPEGRHWLTTHPHP